MDAIKETVREVTLTDANDIIGLYPLTNCGTLVIHNINDLDELVEVSLNGEDKDWYPLADDPEQGQGFLWGELFVPFSDVMSIGCA